MESQLDSRQLEKSQDAIFEDAIKFAILGAIFYIPSFSIYLLTLYIEVILWGAILYSPLLLSAFLGFICSKTQNKSYLKCYSFILVITSINFGLLAATDFAVVIKLWIELSDYECYDSCIGQGLRAMAAYWLVILEFLLIPIWLLAIYAVRHSNKVKGLLPREMREYQVPLMAQQRNHVFYLI